MSGKLTLEHDFGHACKECGVTSLVKILHRYFIFNFIGPFLGSFLFFVAFLLTFQLFRIMEIVVKKNVDWAVILQLVGHMSVSFIPMSMPLAVFFSVIYAVSKMNDDAEVMAMRSIGFSKELIFLPFLVTSILLGGVLLSINQQLIPHSQAIFKNQMVKLSSNSLLSEIKPGQFFTEIPKKP